MRATLCPSARSADMFLKCLRGPPSAPSSASPSLNLLFQPSSRPSIAAMSTHADWKLSESDIHVHSELSIVRIMSALRRPEKPGALLKRSKGQAASPSDRRGRILTGAPRRAVISTSTKMTSASLWIVVLIPDVRHLSERWTRGLNIDILANHPSRRFSIKIIPPHSPSSLQNN